MNIIPRTSLIIYLKHMKHERQIRKYGHIALKPSTKICCDVYK